MIYFQIFVIVVILSTREIRSETIIQSLVKFCSSNGSRFVSFLKNTTNHEKKNILKEANRNEIRSRFLSSAKIEQNIEVFTDTIVIFNEADFDLENSLKLIQSRKILKSILVLKEDRMDTLRTYIENAKSSSLFYLLSFNETNLNWYQVFILKDLFTTDIVINELEFDSLGRVVENYDLKGIKIHTNTMDWIPFISLADCDKRGMNCNSYGSYVDLMNFWARDFNFTWEAHDNINKDWGLKPKSGKPHFILFSFVPFILTAMHQQIVFEINQYHKITQGF